MGGAKEMTNDFKNMTGEEILADITACAREIKSALRGCDGHEWEPLGIVVDGKWKYMGVDGCKKCGTQR